MKRVETLPAYLGTQDIRLWLLSSEPDLVNQRLLRETEKVSIALIFSHKIKRKIKRVALCNAPLKKAIFY